MKNPGRKIFKRLLWLFVLGFALANTIAFFHAYKFTHFSDAKDPKTPDPSNLSFGGKIKALVFGIGNPRPENDILPNRPYKIVKLISNKTIECWSTEVQNAKGTVILFHGYRGVKSSLLDISNAFSHLGYNTFMVDFMGSGGSEGNQTTLGFKEAEEVKTSFDFVSKSGEKRIYLYGISMGAVAVLKSIKDYRLKPRGIFLECPFGTMYKTAAARFRTMRVPSFPMAGLLVFWGGVQNGFWAFSHQPQEYAKSVNSPVLMFYGDSDSKVSRTEISSIYSNFAGPKRLCIFPNTEHENYLLKNKQVWLKEIELFLNNQ